MWGIQVLDIVCVKATLRPFQIEHLWRQRFLATDRGSSLQVSFTPLVVQPFADSTLSYFADVIATRMVVRIRVSDYDGDCLWPGWDES